MKVRSSKRSGEKGQAVIMITFGIAFLLGLLGLVVDVGYAYYVKQAAQGATDAAVMAAIAVANTSRGACGTSVLCQTSYSCPVNPTSATDFGVGCLYAKTNGFIYSGNQTVTISSGTGVPPSAPGINTKHWVTVTATQKLTLGFLAALGIRDGSVWAQSSAAVVVSPNPSCIYVLEPSLGPALKVNGGANLQSNCGIYVNSAASNAFSVSNNATVTASVINVVGGASYSGASVTPTPTTGMPLVADPLANLPAPAIPGCDHSAVNISSGTVTLSPGVYCGGINITGQANVTFSPGSYILNGGGFSCTGNNSVLNGSGVFFYNTSSAGYNFAPISISGGTSITLSAPTSGDYQGILFFQDRSITGGSSSITGSSSTSLSGTVYLPTGDLSFSGNSTASMTLALIVRNLTVSGNSQLQKDTTGAVTAVKTIASLVQ